MVRSLVPNFALSAPQVCMHVQNGVNVDMHPLGCTVSHLKFIVLRMFPINSLRIANCMFVEVWKHCVHL